MSVLNTIHGLRDAAANFGDEERELIIRIARVTRELTDLQTQLIGVRETSRNMRAELKPLKDIYISN